MMRIETTIGIVKNEIVNRGYDVEKLCDYYSYGVAKYMLAYLNVPGRSKMTTKKQMWEAIYPILKSDIANDNPTYKNLASYWRMRNR